MLIRFLTTAWVLAGLDVSAAHLERATMIPDGWKMLDEAPDPLTPMRVSIALRQPNIHHLPSKILSNRLLAREDVQSLRQPAEDDVHRVMKWLSENGITTTANPDQDWIHLTTTVGEVDKLLDTRLHRYSFGDDGKATLRTTEYSIPDELTSAIDFVHPISNFMTPEHEVLVDFQLPKQQQQQKKKKKRKNQSRHNRRDLACGQNTTLDCISRLYGINYSTPDGRSPVRFGVAGFLDQWANYGDLRQNFEQSRPDLIRAGYNFTVESINGGENKQDAGKAGSEASLDIQYAMAVGFPTNVIYYSTGGRGEKLDGNGKPLPADANDNEPYLDFFQHIANKPDHELPHVISMSYADDEYSVPKPYAIRVCNEIGMLTARGVSILGGSGDGGAMGAQKNPKVQCRAHDGSDRGMTVSTFPASCPWVTSVGAVNNGQEPPQGADFSGGGFSDFFPRPDWQTDAVDEYVAALQGHLQGYYNPGMRATPDISVVGTQFKTIINGESFLLAGTSASVPVLAAMIALVNDARLRKDKRPLGWLNGRLYSKKVRDVLQDVTDGRSYSCQFPDGQTPGGWPATRGYDAMTGLGVPNDFGKFMDVLVDE
ncbi:hypothetical protein E4U21_006294 [Claviceps maximensis]|nr:hypothetical protein E4U21_006294 [Claviceps maximensis]